MPIPFPFLSRRLFLKGSAALVAGAFLPSYIDEAVSHAKGSSVTTLKVGAIVPFTRHFFAFGRDLTTGLSLALSHTPFSVQLHSMEYGTTITEAYDAADVLLKEGVDVIVATIGTKGTETLSELCATAERPLIIANTGEDAVRNIAATPFTFHNTLNNWQAAYALGQWAAYNRGQRAMTIGGFYDSGYDNFYAFEAGFVAAGGDVVGRHISSATPDKYEFDGVVEAVRTYQPDFVFAAYSGNTTNRFLNDVTGQLGVPVLGAPFLTEFYPAPDIYSVGAWSPALKTSATASFLDLYQKSTGEAPSAISLLGWDTGTLIATAFQNAGSTEGRALQAALRTASCASPRGMLRMDAATQSVSGPLYLRRSDGTTHQIESELPAPQLPLPVEGTGLSTGWVYPYLT